MDGGNIREINAGKCIIAFGALFFPSCSGDCFAVKDNNHSVGTVTGGKTQTVGQIGLGICDLHVNRLLGPGDDDGF